MTEDPGMTDEAAALHAVLAERFGHPIDVPAGLAGLSTLLRLARQTSHRAWRPDPRRLRVSPRRPG